MSWCMRLPPRGDLSGRSCRGKFAAYLPELWTPRCAHCQSASARIFGDSRRQVPRSAMIDITPYLRTTRIAYFSMEIGIRAEMHTYSGGLGILAGDAARTAADLGLPMVFVTLASRSGYLRQEIDPQGGQIDHPDPWDPEDYTQGLGVMVAVEIEGRTGWVGPGLHHLKSTVQAHGPDGLVH